MVRFELFTLDVPFASLIDAIKSSNQWYVGIVPESFLTAAIAREWTSVLTFDRLLLSSMLRKGP